MGFCGELRANTAVDVLIGPFIDDTDGKTAETGLTISQADVLLSKLGQALAQKNDANAAAHDANGYHNCPLDTTDTATEGSLTLIVHESGALPVRHDFMVLAEAAWDSKYVAKDDGYMDVNIKAVSEDTTAADNLESACDNYSATRGLAGTALPAAAAGAAGGLPVSTAGSLDLDAKLAATNEVTAARMGALTDLIDGGRLDLILDAILVDTGTTLQGELDGIQADTEDLQTQIGTAGAGLTAITNRLVSLALATGVVVADAGNTASSFMTDLAGADNFWNDGLILVTSGALAGQVKEIGDFADADGVVTLTSGQAFTDTPAGDVTFVIINR